MRDYFLELADAACTQAAGVERTSLYFAAESSDFLRFNGALVRQATHVEQRYGTISVVAGPRRAAATCSLGGDLATDVRKLLAERDLLTQQLAMVPDDPFLQLPDAVQSTTRDDRGALPSAGQVIGQVARTAAGTDLVGFHASGPVVRAYADSRGQRNWHRVDNFHFEWSLVHQADLAVKAAYAGTDWSDAGFASRMESARKQLEVLARPRMTLAPGAYRVCFSPVAVADLLAALAWGGFGVRGVRTGVSCLIQLHRREREFHPSVHLAEATNNGLAPCFQKDGFVKPDHVLLVDLAAPPTCWSRRAARASMALPATAAAWRPPKRWRWRRAPCRPGTCCARWAPAST